MKEFMKQKEIITLIIMPLISMFVALITSWFVTRMTINNQNDILERDYKLKIIDKRITVGKMHKGKLERLPPSYW